MFRYMIILLLALELIGFHLLITEILNIARAVKKIDAQLFTIFAVTLVLIYLLFSLVLLTHALEAAHVAAFFISAMSLASALRLYANGSGFPVLISFPHS